MKYCKNVTLKNGMECFMRNGVYSDGEAVYENFNITHSETDFLLSYPEENSFDPEKEGLFLNQKTESPNEIEIIAFVNDKVVGTAGIEAVGTKYKVRHRAEFGISLLKDYWGIGIGKALMDACIECAKKAGYVQLELDVVADNVRAISMYEKAGFVEYGRNPKGFQSRTNGFQEIVYMKLEL